jgi:hypothetical protein
MVKMLPLLLQSRGPEGRTRVEEIAGLLASLDRRSKNVLVLAIVIPKRDFSNLRRRFPQATKHDR